MKIEVKQEKLNPSRCSVKDSNDIFLWGIVLLLAVWAADWGAERLAKPLKKLRRQWGLTEVAGAGFVGLAAASPEIGINTTNAIQGVSDIGLGVMLGSNILAIPLVVTQKKSCFYLDLKKIF